MPCQAQEYHPKLQATSRYCKSLSSIIRETYAHCHAPCVRIPAAGWSSGDDTDDDDDSFLEHALDTKQVILKEMRNRQMKGSRCNVDSPTPSSPFVWSFTPLDPRSVLETLSIPKKYEMEEEEEKKKKGKDDDHDEEDAGHHDGGDADDESEAFFSVKSFFSRSTSRGATVASSLAAMDPPPPLQSPAAWECFIRDCEGWPFGLCRRPAVLPLPPLPSSPADPWKWRNRSISSSSLAASSPAPAYSYKTTTSS